MVVQLPAAAVLAHTHTHTHTHTNTHTHTPEVNAREGMVCSSAASWVLFRDDQRQKDS